jgi:hypothetical protein
MDSMLTSATWERLLFFVVLLVFVGAAVAVVLIDGATDDLKGLAITT